MEHKKPYQIALDGLAISFEYSAPEIGELLDFLFEDIRSQADDLEVVAHYRFDRDDDQWRLQQTDGEFSMLHADSIEFALPLLNHIMRHFSDHNRDSITLHSALVSDDEGAILMPGAPGSGKSMACLWLAHLGLNYHTDEMVTIDRKDLSMHALTRPFTLRRPSLFHFFEQSGLDMKALSEQGALRTTGQSAWIAHRSINPRYRTGVPHIKAIVFPVFTTGDLCQITEISRAHAGMELMRSQFQSQSLEDHGFAAISQLVKNQPVYMMVYNRFDQIGPLLSNLLERHRV